MPPIAETNQEADDGHAEAEAPEAEAAEGVDQANDTDDTTESGEEVEAAEGDDDTKPGEEEFIEVEHQGQKLKLPKAAEPLILLQQDYTKKTQQVAAERQALERRSQELSSREQSSVERDAQYAEAETAYITAQAEVVSLDHSIQAYGKLIEQAQASGDDDRVRDLRFDLADLRETRRALVEAADGKKAELKGHIERAGQAAESARQERIQAGVAVLQKDHGVTFEDFKSVASHLQGQFGITPEESYGALADPRMILVAKAAAQVPTLQAELKKAREEVAALKKAKTAKDGEPAKTVRGKTPAGKDPDKMTTDEYMAWEAERVSRDGRRRPNGQWGTLA